MSKQNKKKKNTSKSPLTKAKVSFGIRKKLLVSFLIPIVFTVILGVISYSKSSKGLVQSYETSTMQSFSAVASHLQFGLETVSSSSINFSFDKNITDYLTKSFSDDHYQYQLLAKNIKNSLITNQISNNFIQNILLIPKENRGVIASGIASTSIPGFFDDLSASSENSKLTYGYWTTDHSVFDEKLNLDYETLITFIRPASVGYGSIVIDINSDTIKDSLYKLAGENTVVGFTTNSSKELILNNSSLPDDFSFTNITNYTDALSSEDMNGSSYVTIQGEKYFFVYQKLSDLDFMICGLVPESIILSSANEIKTTTYVLTGISLLLIIITILVLSNNIGSNIKKLMTQFEMVSSGDLTIEPSIHSKDELNSLAQSIGQTLRKIRSLIQNVSTTSELVATSASNVIENSNNLSKFSESVSDSMKQITASIEGEAQEAQQCVNQMETLSSKITSINDKVSDIENFANQTKEIVNNNLSIMKVMNEYSANTSSIMNTLSTEMSSLEKKNESINSFIEIINGISEQTNLLSLNASIEAARAGESGKGFSVVADEIRKLSVESSKAANEIKKVADAITLQTTSTVSQVSNAENIVDAQNQIVLQLIDAFHSLEDGINQLFHYLMEIVKETKEVSEARSSTLGSISNISASTEETYSVSLAIDGIIAEQAQTVQQLEKLSSELQGKANELEESIGLFKI